LVVQLVELLIAPAFHLRQVAELEARDLLVGVAAGEEGSFGLGVVPEPHVGLAQTEVGEGEQRVELDGALELPDGLIQPLRAHGVLPLLVMVQRLTLALLFLARALLGERGQDGKDGHRDGNKEAHGRKTAGGRSLPPASHLDRRRSRRRASRQTAC
jgi:hypothetical protein